MDKEQHAADKLYKSHFGKMVTAMLQFSRDIDIETAEDLVQDAFYAALSSWKHKGIPDNPAGWIYTVCRNNAINTLKKNKSFKNPFEEDHPCHLRIHNRKGKKFITEIEGLDPQKYSLKVLLSEMKHKFCTNGSLSQSNVLQLNGDQRQLVKNFLIEKEICRADQIIIHGVTF